MCVHGILRSAHYSQYRLQDPNGSVYPYVLHIHVETEMKEKGKIMKGDDWILSLYNRMKGSHHYSITNKCLTEK